MRPIRGHLSLATFEYAVPSVKLGRFGGLARSVLNAQPVVMPNRSMAAPTASKAQRGFTLIELMAVVVILAVLAVVAVVAYSKQMRAAHKTEVISDLSNLTLRQKTFIAKTGHYASSTNCEGPTCTYPLAADLTAVHGPLPWNVADTGYTAAGAAGAFFRGTEAVHGFDALQFMPEGGDSWCGYATISGWGSTAEDGNDDVPADLAEPLISQEFPAAAGDQFSARDWFLSYALCDFDSDGVYWAFTTTHFSANINPSTDATGTYFQDE